MQTPFEIATAQRDQLDAMLKEALGALRELTDDLAGDTPRVMGLTPDHVKANPDWRAAKSKADALFQALRTFNGFYVRHFRRELAVSRAAALKQLTR